VVGHHDQLVAERSVPDARLAPRGAKPLRDAERDRAVDGRLHRAGGKRARGGEIRHGGGAAEPTQHLPHRERPRIPKERGGVGVRRVKSCERRGHRRRG
jgi:hypothetical protein